MCREIKMGFLDAFRKKLRDPETLNLLARPRYDPASASLRRRLLSLVLAVLVGIFAAYEIDRGTTESESFVLPLDSCFTSRAMIFIEDPTRSTSRATTGSKSGVRSRTYGRPRCPMRSPRGSFWTRARRGTYRLLASRTPQTTTP